jgi:hypothetical protein
VKLADEVCDLKRVVIAIGNSDNPDQRTFIATEVFTNGFDNISPDQMIKRLANDHQNMDHQDKPTPQTDTLPGGSHVLCFSQSSLMPLTQGLQGQNVIQTGRPEPSDHSSIEMGELDAKEVSKTVTPLRKSPGVEAPCRSSTMSRPNSTDDFFGTINNRGKLHEQPKHNTLNTTNESLSFSPLLWSHTVSQDTGTSSDAVLTPLETSTPFDSATNSTSVASSLISDSRESSESGETYSTSNSSEYSTDDLLRDIFSEPTVAEYKRELVERVMRDLCSTICISELVRSLPTSDESTNSGTNATSQRSSSSVSKSPETKGYGRRDGRKRKKTGNEDGNSDEENENRHNSTELHLSGQERRRLGCPYYLRSPWKYSARRTCAGPGWHDARHVR